MHSISIKDTTALFYFNRIYTENAVVR